MKLIILLVATTAFLSASEFKYIQPIAIEEAPKKEAIVIKEELIIEELIEEPEVEEEEEELSDFSENLTLKDDGSTQTATLKVNFKRNSYDVLDQYLNEIKEFALFLEEHKGYLVVVYGYTDSMGRAIDNKILSQNRANSIKSILEDYGIDGIRITAIGKGEKGPIADNMYKDGRAINRRIEVDLLE